MIMNKYFVMILVCFGTVNATPPDVVASDIVLLGGSSEKAVFLVKTGYNMGNHWEWENRWYYLCMDLSECTFEYIFQGSLITAPEEYGGVRYSPNSESLSIPGILQYWDVSVINLYSGRHAYLWDSEGVIYSIRDNSLCLASGDEEIVITGIKCFDPFYLAFWNTEFGEYFFDEEECAVREIDIVDISPYVVSFELEAAVQLGAVHLLIGQISGEDYDGMGFSRGVILYFPALPIYELGL